MKKTILLLLAGLLAIPVIRAAHVPITTAEKAGKNYYFRQINRTKSVPYSSVAIQSHFTEQSGDTILYYVFNLQPAGYVIVSADDACFPIIGYSFDGSCESSRLPANFKGWMHHYKQEIAWVIRMALPSDQSIRNTWTSLLSDETMPGDNVLANTDVSPLLTSLWDQTGPYNDMCPPDAAGPGGHVLVGCVATAMAQVMYYWRYPQTGQGTHCDSHTYNGQQYCADFGSTTYDWNGMVDQPSKQCDPVALISYHAGVAVNMNYGVSASGAYSTTISGAMRQFFKYSNTISYQTRPGSTTTWINKLKADLDAKRPVIYSGYGPDGGHCFVCDGYQGTDMFHFNWGWSGSSNGYFNISNLNPGGMTFNDGQDAVFNIEPDPAQYPYNCAGITNVTTYGFGTIEDGSGPVSDYQNNETCSWLIGPDDSVKNVKLTFSRFDLSAGDEVMIYDGPTSSDPLLGTYTGSSLPAALTSTGPQMLVTFTTDGTGTSPGWMADYTCTYNPFCESTTTLTDLSGDFSDGSGRFLYRNGNICKWKILPYCFSIGSATLSFQDFKTEQGGDKVQIYDLMSASSALATYSGIYTTPPPAVTSPSGKFLIIFTTNSSNRNEGWSAHYDVDCLNVNTDEKILDHISVFPNPASDYLQIDLGNTALRELGIDVFSSLGTRIYSGEVARTPTTDSQSINVSNWLKGIYFIRLTSQGETRMEKIIIR